MRSFICVSSIALFVLVAMAESSPVTAGASEPKPQYNLDDAPALFEQFIKDYDRHYKDDNDRQIHYEAFVKSLQSINRLNADPKNGSATFGINKFADHTEEERKNMFGLIHP